MLLHADFPSGSEGVYGSNVAFMSDGGGYATQEVAVLAEDPDPNVTGRVAQFSQNNTLRWVLPAAVAGVGVGVRIWLPKIFPSTVVRVAVFYNSAADQHVYVGVDINGYIRAYNGNGTLLGITTAPAVVTNAWQHIETKCTISDTVGTVEVRVDGVVKLDLENVDTKNGADTLIYSAGIRFSGVADSDEWYAKDLVIWDTSGTENNDFLGTVGVYWSPVASDVSSGWTRSSGATDYGLLNESPPVDAGYISAGDPPPAASIMGVTALPADIVAIRGIISVVRAAKSDSGDGFLQVSLSPNGVDQDAGADRPMTTAFTYWRDVSELSPDSGAAWTPSEFATLEMKLDRTA